MTYLQLGVQKLWMPILPKFLALLASLINIHWKKKFKEKFIQIEVSKVLILKSIFQLPGFFCFASFV